MMFRRYFLTALVGLVTCLAHGPSSASAGEQDPKIFVAHLADQAMETMTAKGLSDQDRASRFRALFTSEVDLPEIAKLVLARHWRTATPEQQQEFVKSFEDIVVLTWSTRFKDYGGDLRHSVVNVSRDEDRVLVDSKVERQSQQPIALQWRLKQSDAGLRVVDLVVEGSSMVITYRAEYASVIQSNGGKVEGLLAAMRTKLAELKAGSATKAN
ncbi:ABC transporter [Paramagnetospirillum kuznetsovii]|uniref:ABC transporter n=1 Tax=Paramagnetospirillum kuznetsovii TaxID=2053833 RepID=A0A364P0R0_9PROT|nr:ABC transporter substrate-binding protein [Paramagnetospirillum kuznetsovii]RAU22840.1 ABC transporter [Paramagnetospirillum kuznetsovii]